DGGLGTLHNRVSYAGDTANLTINLIAGTGLGGNAQGDTYTNIQDATGGSGDDTFIASAAANNFDGGGGSNTVSYAGQSVAVKVNLSSQLMSGVAANTGSGGFAAGDTYTNIQNAIGGTGNDTLIGASTGTTVLTGGLGNDTLIGIAANSANTYASYAGSNVGVTVNLLTGVGANGHAAGDTLTDIDNLIGSSLNDTFIANGKVNIFNGGAGNDTVSYAGSGAAVIANLNTTTGSAGNATNDVYISIENLTGSDYDDTLTGLTAGGSILTGGLGADKMYGLGTNNTINYAGSSLGVTIDLFNGNAIGSAVGSEAYGDTFSGIQNVIGSTSNDIFYASNEANIFTGNGGVDTVNYQYSDLGVTVNLNTGVGTFGFAAGDTYVGIQNVVGSAFNDTFVANSTASVFNGGSAGSDTVDYSASGAVGVTVNLFNGTGTGGYAQGDSYVSIENVIGTAGNDLFYASAAANNFNGGTGGNDTVSYQFSTGQPIVANLLTGQGTGGDANGDRYTSIENLTGSAFVDSNLTGDGLANILTALGVNTTNILDGGAGNDTLDGRLGGHNTLIGGAGDDLFWVKVGADGSTIANVDHITGGDGADTLRIDGLLSNLNMTTFLAGTAPNTYKASGITTLDVRDSVSTTLTFTAQDVINMGVNNQLTVRMDGGDTLKVSGNAVAGNGYFAFYDASNTTEVARINFLYA
ncbi:beta strand repeat-containing protein, partial [Herminiimonas glaciei]